MSTPVNKHGLSRYIPAEIRREIRRECGFGCVTCGLAIAQYEHIDPTFEEAKVHDPERIALLCGACHDKVTRGLWSKEKVRTARLNPLTFAEGRCRDAFDLRGPICVVLGQNEFHDFRTLVRSSDGENWLEVEPPNMAGAPFFLSGTFYDDTGSLALRIERNDWWCPTTVWDLDVVGRTLTVRHRLGDIALRLRADPPHRLVVERLLMRRGGLSVEVDAMGVVLLQVGTKSLRMELSAAMGTESVIVL